MKNIALIIILTGCLFSCKNSEWEFDDFDYTTVYFPYQFPLRTLVLGDYAYDNENDNNLKFLISARVGGMYKNNRDWTLDYEVANDLTINLKQSDGQEIRILPHNYYTLNPVNKIAIPKGQFHGSVEVQLTEEFLNDPLAISLNYVIPLRITASSADSILSGKPDKSNADPRIAGDWVTRPKNYTLFGVKYVNPYHGKYLHRGQSVIKDENDDVMETVVYRQRFVENDEVWALKTNSRRSVVVEGQIRASAGSPGKFNMELTFDNNDNCIITETSNSAFPVVGSGKFVKDGGEWGNKKRDAIFLNYQINVNNTTHFLTDTLVIRDRDVRFETFNPIVAN
jgi:hypothetical protein